MKLEISTGFMLGAIIISLISTNLTFASNQQSLSITSNGTISYPSVANPIKKSLICFGVDNTFWHDGSGDWHSDNAAWASKFDMVVCGPTVTNVATVKALNPNIVVLGYKDLVGMKEDMDDWAVVNQHEDWFMHDIYGNRLQTDPNLWSWWLMNISNPGYRQHLVDYCTNFLTTRNFDGVFCDDPWLGVWKDWFTWKYPANTIPNTPNWANDMKSLLTLLKQQIGSKLLTVNYDASELPYSDGIWMENFVAYGIDTPTWDGYTPIRWVDTLYQNSASGKIVVAFCHYPRNMDYNDFRFAFGCYLLGINGPNTYFNWIDIWSPSHGYYPEMDTNLGAPLGAYQVQNGLYIRNFTNLQVIVNMTAQTVQLLPQS